MSDTEDEDTKSSIMDMSDSDKDIPYEYELKRQYPDKIKYSSEADSEADSDEDEIEGEGEPLLIIPGGPGNSHTYFHPWFSELAKNYKLIYLDAFGRRKSDRAEDPVEYTFERDVEDIELLRRTLKYKK